MAELATDYADSAERAHAVRPYGSVIVENGVRPYMSVVTRHMPSRRNMLTINQASLEMQTDPDYEHLVLVDDVGRGWEYAHQLMMLAAEQVTGEYVLALDDDDCMINANGIERIKIATVDRPGAVIWRAWHNELGILPDNGHWQRAPEYGFIGACGFAVRRDLFVQTMHEMQASGYRGRYASDFDLISTVYERCNGRAAWLDELVCWAMRRSLGRE